MALQGPSFWLALRVPEPRGPIVAARRDPSTIRAERHRRDAVAVPRFPPELLAVEVPQSTRAVGTTAEDGLSVGAEGHGEHAFVNAGEGPPARSAVHLPDTNCPVVSGAHQEVLGRVGRDCRNPTRVPGHDRPLSGPIESVAKPAADRPDHLAWEVLQVLAHCVDGQHQASRWSRIQRLDSFLGARPEPSPGPFGARLLRQLPHLFLALGLVSQTRSDELVDEGHIAGPSPGGQELLRRLKSVGTDQVRVQAATRIPFLCQAGQLRSSSEVCLRRLDCLGQWSPRSKQRLVSGFDHDWARTFPGRLQQACVDERLENGLLFRAESVALHPSTRGIAGRAQFDELHECRKDEIGLPLLVERREQFVRAILEGDEDPAHVVVGPFRDASLRQGPLVQLAEGVRKQRKGIPALCLIHHSLDQAVVELDPCAVGRRQDDFAQAERSSGPSTIVCPTNPGIDDCWRTALRNSDRMVISTHSLAVSAWAAARSSRSARPASPDLMSSSP